MWVVRDPQGLRGGLFTSRREALRFATLDHGRPQSAVLVPYPVEFDTTQTYQPERTHAHG